MRCSDATPARVQTHRRETPTDFQHASATLFSVVTSYSIRGMLADSNGRTSQRLVIACAGVVATHGAIVLLGWWQQWSLFTQPPAGFIPMAPTTAAAFLLLAAVVVIRTRFSSPGGRRAARGAAGLVLLLAAFALAARLAGSALDPDAAIRVTTATLGRVPLGVMSPVTAAAVLLLALALMLLTFERPA